MECRPIGRQTHMRGQVQMTGGGEYAYCRGTASSGTGVSLLRVVQSAVNDSATTWSVVYVGQRVPSGLRTTSADRFSEPNTLSRPVLLNRAIAEVCGSAYVRAYIIRSHFFLEERMSRRTVDDNNSTEPTPHKMKHTSSELTTRRSVRGAHPSLSVRPSRAPSSPHH